MIVHTFNFEQRECGFNHSEIKKINGVEYIITDSRYYLKWDLAKFKDFCHKVQEYMDYTENPHTRPTERPIINSESLSAYMYVSMFEDVDRQIKQRQEEILQLENFKNNLKNE
jgi:endo-1,4-beta-D-glucanase Y